MSQVEEAIREHEERCAEQLPKRFVPWTWVVGICITILMTIGGAAWGLSGQINEASHNATYAVREVDNAKSKNYEQDTRIVKLEVVVENQMLILQEIRALRNDVKKSR